MIEAVTRRAFLTSLALAGPVAVAVPEPPGVTRTKRLILITADGLRWQDLFAGIDPLLMKEKDAGMGEAEELRRLLWRTAPEERRTALMPFFWKTLVPDGVVLGNVRKGSSIQVTNRYRVSYPGYSEILTGRTQDEAIRGNDPVQNPTPSFLQFLKGRWKLPTEQVAVFASWQTMHAISESKRGEIFVNAGYETSSAPGASSLVAQINKFQQQARFVEDSSRHDAFTFALAMDYLKTIQPTLMYLSFDETDDWAHHKRDDRVLQSIQFLDGALQELWTWLQNSPVYRDSTTLLLTTDHGRGSTKDDWSSHGPDVPGDEQIWIAAIGPDTPARGEAVNGEVYYQRDIAPTALELLGVDFLSYPGVKGKPIPLVLGR